MSESEPKQNTSQTLSTKGKAFEGRNQIEERKEIKCYLCDGPHLIRDCPKKKTFYAMVLQEEKEAHMSSM